MTKLGSNEKWVIGFRNYYSVTDDFRVFSHKSGDYYEMSERCNERVNPFVYKVTLRGKRSDKVKTIATIVYEAFVRPLEDNEKIVAANGDEDDVRIENLLVVEKSRGGFRSLIPVDDDSKFLIYSEKYPNGVYFEGMKNSKAAIGIAPNTFYRLITASVETFIHKGHKYHYIQD